MSFQIVINPARRAAARLVADVRQRLQQALADEGVTQSYVADKIGVDRSVVNRQIKGQADLSLSRVGEIAEILGYDADFVLSKRQEMHGNNAGTRPNITVVTNDIGKGVAMRPSSGIVFEVSANLTTISKAESQ